MNEVAVKEENALLTKDDIEFIRRYDEIKKRYKVWESSHEEMFRKFLEDSGSDSYTQDGTTIYLTRPYTKKQIDVQALKDEGLYDLYTKDVEVKGSLKIKVEYED